MTHITITHDGCIQCSLRDVLHEFHQMEVYRDVPEIDPISLYCGVIPEGEVRHQEECYERGLHQWPATLLALEVQHTDPGICVRVRPSGPSDFVF